MEISMPVAVILGVPCVVAALLATTWGLKRFMEEVQDIQEIIKQLRKGGG